MQKVKVYFPNLDGIRFICFFSVFLYHSFAIEDKTIANHPFRVFIKRLFQNGSLGVNFFFVLSGFLITYLLIAEKSTTGRITIKAFYVRRILRIWPLYFFCVAFGFIAFPFLKSLFGETASEPAHPLMYITFLSNFDYIRIRPDASVLAVLWSVAVEEQFYLFWPLLLSFIPFKWYNLFFGIIILISLIFRLYHLNDAHVLDVHTLSIIGDFGVGAIVAFAAFTNVYFLQLIKNIPRSIIVIVYISIGVVFFFRMEIFRMNPALIVFERLILSLFFVFIIAEQCFSQNSFFKFSNSKFLSKWGNYTYGLYCLHFISILIIHTIIMKFALAQNVYLFIFVEGIASLLLVMGMAYISYHYFESPFLRLKKRFEIIKTK